MTSTCFICGLESDDFDNHRPGSFKAHVRHEHNMWAYLYFLHHLRRKNQDDYTGQESYVASMIAENDLSFFPQGKAMSHQVVDLDQAEETDENNAGKVSRDSEEGGDGKKDDLPTTAGPVPHRSLANSAQSGEEQQDVPTQRGGNGSGVGSGRALQVGSLGDKQKRQFLTLTEETRELRALMGELRERIETLKNMKVQQSIVHTWMGGTRFRTSPDGVATAVTGRSRARTALLTSRPLTVSTLANGNGQTEKSGPFVIGDKASSLDTKRAVHQSPLTSVTPEISGLLEELSEAQSTRKEFTAELEVLRERENLITAEVQDKKSRLRNLRMTIVSKLRIIIKQCFENASAAIAGTGASRENDGIDKPELEEEENGGYQQTPSQIFGRLSVVASHVKRGALQDRQKIAVENERLTKELHQIKIKYHKLASRQHDNPP